MPSGKGIYLGKCKFKGIVDELTESERFEISIEQINCENSSHTIDFKSKNKTPVGFVTGDKDENLKPDNYLGIKSIPYLDGCEQLEQLISLIPSSDKSKPNKKFFVPSKTSVYVVLSGNFDISSIIKEYKIYGKFEEFAL